ncbi:MAG: acyl--CoA ligase, partial [Leptospiraceae bacterium]|nr:acyl--CoA ligase [Leptospiraceae bacterium]
ILPHFHAFGLIIELLIFIFTSSIIIRDEKDGKDPENIIKLIDKWNVTHLNGVPLTIEKILSLPKGTDYLRNLKGGIIGGASITEKISSYLFGSNLRVGYGQTEASPGITLGEFGILYTNFLGNEVGCEVKIKEGELLFKGNNNFNSLFTGDFQDFSKERWIETGDIVEKKDNGYYFVSRKDFLIKLNNGKMLYPEKLELELKNKISQITEICIIPSKNNRVLILYNSLQENLNDRIFTYLPDYLKKNSEIKFLKKSISITPKGAVDRKKIILEADSFETISIFTGR